MKFLEYVLTVVILMLLIGSGTLRIAIFPFRLVLVYSLVIRPRKQGLAKNGQ